MLLPCYGDQAGLDRTLTSLAREREAFDVLLVDDGSPTPLEAPSTVGTHRVTLVRLEPNRGLDAVLALGSARVRDDGYPFLGRIDAGDLAKNQRFAAQLAYLRAHPECACLGTSVSVVEPDGRVVYQAEVPTSHDAIVRALRYGNCMYHPSLVMRTDALFAVGGYRADAPACEDYDLVQRFARRYAVANLPAAHLDYELAPNSISRSRRHAQLRSRLRVQLRYFDPTDVHAYAGAALTLAMLPIPAPVVSAAKRAIGRLPF